MRPIEQLLEILGKEFAQLSYYPSSARREPGTGRLLGGWQAYASKHPDSYQKNPNAYDHTAIGDTPGEALENLIVKLVAAGYL